MTETYESDNPKPAPDYVGYGTESKIVARHNVSSDAYLARKYGINRWDFVILYRRQDGACAICEKFFPKLVVDHEHRNDRTCMAGDVRGLLCNECNMALGHFQDNPQHIASAIGYLLFFEEKGFPWNGNDACHICRTRRVRRKEDLVGGEWLGNLCDPCLRGIRLFYRSIFNLRMALGYLYFYEHRPTGEPYWQNAADGAVRYGNLRDQAPEDLLMDYWWDVQKRRFPDSGPKALRDC